MAWHRRLGAEQTADQPQLGTLAGVTTQPGLLPWVDPAALPTRPHGDEHWEGLGLALTVPMPFPAYLLPPRAPLQPNPPDPLSLNLACIPTSTLCSGHPHAGSALVRHPPRPPLCVTLTSWPGLPLPPPPQ